MEGGVGVQHQCIRSSSAEGGLVLDKVSILLSTPWEGAGGEGRESDQRTYRQQC
jgi:hypothetical protein